MAIEISMKSFKNDIAKAQNQKIKTNKKILYDEALELVRESISTQMLSNFDESKVGENVLKNKEYLRKLKKEKTNAIREIINKLQIRCEEFPNSEDLLKELVEDIVGYSVLADAFYDDSISDIFCNSWDNIIVQKNGIDVPYGKSFKSPLHFKDFIFKILREAGKEINNGDCKIVDFDLYEDRYCAISKVVSPRGYTLAIRKHSEEHIKLQQLLEKEVINQEISDALGQFIFGESNMIIAGITGSGKTTTMRALLDYHVKNANKRMLICEDTRELFIDNKNALELVSVKNDSDRLEITLSDLIITALRLKPKYIVCGEVRNVEIESAVEAMSTGHSTITTIHAGIPMDCINRIVTKYLMAMPSLGNEIVERIIGSALDYIVIQDDIPGIGRKVTSVTEVSYDYKESKIKLKTIFEFNIREKKFKTLNKISEEKANKMLRRGVKFENIAHLVEGWN